MKWLFLAEGQKINKIGYLMKYITGMLIMMIAYPQKLPNTIAALKNTYR